MISNQRLLAEEADQNNNTFSEKRDKIKRFFENANLKHSTLEFYQVQKTFHQNMANLVNGFTQIKPLLPTGYRYLLIELLIPYRVLSDNLFDEPTGDIEIDIKHILYVISKDNEHFKIAISMMLISISNLVAFNKLLKDCQQHPVIAQQLKDGLHCNSWMIIQGFVEHPFQNLIRYELLLKTIQKHLTEIGCAPTEVLENMQRSINYLVPEVKNINECREILLLLNKVERVLGSLLADAILKKEAESDAEIKPSISLKEQIESIMICVKTGKTNIIQDKQDILSLYEAIHELLDSLLNRYLEENRSKSYTLYDVASSVASTGYYLLSIPMAMFGEQSKPFKPLDPLADLKEVTKELHDTIEQTEALKNIHTKLSNSIVKQN